MSRPVSIVIPCYNQAEFLAEAIESVLNQTYKPLELIVVDDGSIDATAAVVLEYDVRSLSQTNQGLSAARNSGLRASTGDYVLFLDADDRLCAGGVAIGVRSLEAHPNCAFTVGGFRNFSENGGQQPASTRRPGADGPYAALLRGNWIEMHGAVLYRRSVFEEVGPFDTSLRACEDYEMYLRITKRFPIATHDGVVAEYRRHPDCMSSDPERILSTALAVLQRQRNFARTNQAYWRAYRAGQRNWRRDYGQRAVGDLITAVKARNWVRAMQRMGTLMRYYPRGLAIGGAQAVERRLKKHDRTAYWMADS